MPKEIKNGNNDGNSDHYHWCQPTAKRCPAAILLLVPTLSEHVHFKYISCIFQVYFSYNTSLSKSYNKSDMIKVTFIIEQFLSHLILLKDCSVLKIYVFISPFKRAMFENLSMFTIRDMKHLIKYPHFQSFYTPNLYCPEKFEYFEMPWIWPHIILFGVYIFLKMATIINSCFYISNLERKKGAKLEVKLFYPS